MFFQLGTGIQGKRLGIVGLGQIGPRPPAVPVRSGWRSTTAAAAAPTRPRGRSWTARFLPFDELVAAADVVSLHCPLTPETTHLVDAAVLARMKPTAFLINTTRGPVVDEAALVDALRDGTIAGAGLDVYEREPVVHPGLLELENVVLLPHLGSATVETRTAMAVLAARNALAVLGGDAALTPIVRAVHSRRRERLPRPRARRAGQVPGHRVGRRDRAGVRARGLAGGLRRRSSSRSPTAARGRSRRSAGPTAPRA